MKSQELFADDVLIHVPGCELEVAYNAIRESAIEFCRRSLIVRKDLDPVELVAGTQDYTLYSTPHETVHMVLRAWYGQRELRLLSPDALLGSMVNPDPEAVGGEPVFVFQRDTTSFSVFPLPTSLETDTVLIRAAFCPTRQATCYADVVYNDWVTTVADGALAILHASPVKPYTDIQSAAYRRSRFLMGVADATRAANRGHARSSLSVRLRPFV